MEWTNDDIFKFIKMYENEPIIWDPKHPCHIDRNIIHDAWKRIHTDFGKDVSIKELKKKKDILMATYRKLSTKVKKSMKTDGGLDEIFKPEWLFYDVMDKFLNEVYEPRTIFLELPAENINVTDKCVFNNDLQEDVKDCLRKSTFPDTVKKRKVVKNLQDVQNSVFKPYNVLNLVSNPEHDECSLYATLLAAKLKSFDENSRQYAMLCIDNFIFSLKTHLTQSNSSSTEVFQNFHEFPHLPNLHNLSSSLTISSLQQPRHSQVIEKDNYSPTSCSSLQSRASTSNMQSPPPSQSPQYSNDAIASNIIQISQQTPNEGNIFPKEEPFDIKEMEEFF